MFFIDVLSDYKKEFYQKGRVMKKVLFFVWLLLVGFPMYTVNAEPKIKSSEDIESNSSLLVRAKKRVRDINLRNLVDLAPFAIVAKCYTESPNLTMVALGVTLIIISLRNQYIQRTVKKQYIDLLLLLKKTKKALAA